MSKSKSSDPAFETSFFESVLRRNPDFTDVVELLGGLYTKQGRIADGLRMDRRLVRLQPRNPTAHYNLACSLALSKRKGDALRILKQAVDLGYDDYEWLSQDPDLDALQSHPGFKKLLLRLRAKARADSDKA